MKKALVLGCGLCLSAPAWAGAAPLPAGEPPAGEALLSESYAQGVPVAATAGPQGTETPPTSPGLRFAAGAGIGTLSGLGGGFLAGAAGFVGGVLSCSSLGCMEPFVYGPAFVGAPLGAALGATLIGGHLGGRGSYWAALVGSAAGAVGTLGVLGLVTGEPVRAVTTQRGPVIAYLVMSGLGAALGYELGSSIAGPAEEHGSRQQVLVAPVVYAEGRVTGIGMVGLF